MIIKYSEIKKINDNNFFLFYGKNDGLKDEIIKSLVGNNKNVLYYEEKEILDHKDKFVESILTNSLFDNEKIIIIKRASDKILSLMESISERKFQNISIILTAENLEKKSKLRIFFEKSKKLICIPFYPDNEYTLLKLTNNLLNKSNIKLSSSNINFIINKSQNDRHNLKNNLLKLEHYTFNKKKINQDVLSKLMNLGEEENISKLTNYYLAKNHKRTINILNENNYSNEDSVIIIRTLLNQSKKILKLVEKYESTKNMELTISSSKPPIFWKDKEITIQQIKMWSLKDIKNLIYKINELEIKIKKNLQISLKLITDFLVEQSNKNLIV